MPQDDALREQVTIEPGRPADADRAVEITREAFDGVSIDQAIERAIGRGGELSWQDVKGLQVRREFQTAPQHCFVARLGGKLVGYVSCDIDAAASRGRISNLAVDRSCRGQGVGRLLILRALDHFRGLGLKQAKIETLATNEIGQHLYPSCGFVEVVRQVHYAMKL